MAEIIACANQKGGVGKTTTVVSLAAWLALSGKRVLVVDVDPQGNATSGLGIDRSALPASLYDVLLGEVAAADAIVPTAIPGCSILPSTRALSGAEIELIDLDQRERRLASILAPVRERFDILLLDCPPSIGLLSVNALTAADSVLVPIQCEYFALEGLGQLMETIALVRAHLNPGLELKGLVLTMWDGRTSLAAAVAADVRTHFGDEVFRTVIPRSVRLAEAPSHGMPIATYDRASRGGQAYAALATELLERSRPMATASAR